MSRNIPESLGLGMFRQTRGREELEEGVVPEYREASFGYGSSGFQCRSKRFRSWFYCLPSLNPLHTVRAVPSVAILLPTAQFGEVLQEVEIHMFHLPVAVPTVALDIAVLACSGDQTHRHPHTEFYRMVFVYRTGREGNYLSHSYQKSMINCNLLFWIPYRMMGFQKKGFAPK